MSKALNAPSLLKPKAAAVWLVENSAQTFDQIAEFTGLHSIEVQALADGDVGRGIIGERPRGLTDEEIEKGNNDNSYIMKLEKQTDLPTIKTRAKGPKYTPVSKRGDKPDAISWILKNHPEISDIEVGVDPTAHVIVDGLQSFALHDEIYHHLAPANGATGMLSAEAEEGPQTLMWAHAFGDGRSVYSSLGHDAASMQQETHRRLLQRSACWALGGDDAKVRAL